MVKGILAEAGTVSARREVMVTTGVDLAEARDIDEDREREGE